jgi:hypothetical protein
MWELEQPSFSHFHILPFSHYFRKLLSVSARIPIIA